MLIDDAVNGMQSALSFAAQKTAEAVENTKSMVDRQKLRGQLNEAYRKLGKEAYESTLGNAGNMSEVKALISEITMLRKGMADIEHHLQHPTGDFCSACGKHLHPEDAYCSACGAPISRR